MNISPEARAVAAQVVESARSFGAGLDESIANQGAGGWDSGPLWDNAILGMRTRAGGLAQDLEYLQLLGDDVIQQLPTELSSTLGDQLAAARRILDEIHTDQGGDFAAHLSAFRTYGDDVASKLEAILAKADEADATAAKTAVNGAEVLNWNLEGVGAATVKETERAAANTKTMEAGGR